MNTFKSACLILFISLIMVSCSNKPIKVLIFSKTEGFRHSCIEDATKSLKKLLDENNIKGISTEDASKFTEESLKNYAAVIFLNTTGDVLDNAQQADFERYIQAGGGFVGIHAATDTEYNWPWYNQLVGAYFNGHPAIQDATLDCVNKEDVCCQGVPDKWTISEEWYNFKSINPDIEIIMNLDESSYTGGTNGANHPAVWKHEYNGGRAFYTAMGHKKETFRDSIFQKQLWEGIKFSMGNGRLDYSKASTQRPLDEDRFSKKVLDFNLNEPMELDQLGSRGIVYIERQGAIKLFDFETEQTINLDTVDVHYDDEDGLIGIAVDPNYDTNHWIYLFYSPNIDEATQHISRFTLMDRQLEDEKILLKVPLIRECCHSGGSLEFGKDGLLYIGIGDNTNPFESSGFAPIDERDGRELFDAQRSAANTNDLRGKILRVKPENDGSYSIPEGNLFPEGTANCRPEIYIMGCRNPFRFAIDSKTNYVYWGDVGPDAGTADEQRGPEGMGEFNQAKAPGFFGWPYSRGNNQMYHDYDFQKEVSGKPFDPSAIQNNSPNNTGLQILPSIQESAVWYSYKDSEAFPWVGKGGVNPMSGPIYHASDFLPSEDAFPPYFEKKWFVYEWMRDWVYVIHLDEQYKVIQADPFMPNTEFSHPMDMMFSSEGKMYVLEYGQKWNSRNLDARLSEITYNAGNKPPVISIESDKIVGATPLKINFSAKSPTESDQEIVEYSWDFEDEIKKRKTAEIEYTFETPGIYDVDLTVKDKNGMYSTSSKKIIAGNSMPKLSINLSDDQSTFNKNRKVTYTIGVTDQEDGSTNNGSINPKDVKVTFTYIAEGEDLIQASIGHQQNIVPTGLELINASGCKACHAKDKKVSGPSYNDIATRYDKEDKDKLIHSIIKGSQGTWGELMMAPHPQLKIEEVDEIVSYILTLDQSNVVEENLYPLEGTLEFKEHLNDEESGKYILMASYLDKGHPDVEGSALSVVEEFVFSPARIELEDSKDIDKDLGIWKTQGRTVVSSIKHNKHIEIESIKYDNLKSIKIGSAFNPDYHYSGTVEIRRGSLIGDVIGQGNIEHFDKENEAFRVFEIQTKTGSGNDRLFLVFRNDQDKEQFIINGDFVELNYSK